ncbi:cytochrome ubiquinol oxidase subunit I [Streptomyces spiralis]
MVWMAPAVVAISGGWITAETGRRPWVVHGLIRTGDAVSGLSLGAAIASIIGFVGVYAAAARTVVRLHRPHGAHGTRAPGDRRRRPPAAEKPNQNTPQKSFQPTGRNTGKERRGHIRARSHGTCSRHRTHPLRPHPAAHRAAPASPIRRTFVRLRK